jgi:hypothetical protein
MKFVENFSSSYYSLEKQGDYILRVETDSSYPYIYRKYDFLARMLFVSGSSSDRVANAIPFSQLDQESLEFLRSLLIEKGGKPPALPNALPQESTETWVRMGDMAIVKTGIYPALQRKLTHIFNLTSRQMAEVNENLETRHTISSEPVHFENLPPAILEKALEEFTKAGGTADKDFVLRGIVKLKKNDLQ